MEQKATLYIVPTPIGNLEDITLRAVRILGEVGLVLAEDTRTTGNLMKHLGISTKLMAHHKFNEHRSVGQVLERLQSGIDVALVSDAGTPSISDPGFLMVRECIRSGFYVNCLPGPTAFVPALVNSGLPSDRFVFEGFLPHKKGRQTRLRFLAGDPRTLVFYESPHRLVKSLLQMAEFFGPGRRASVSRELTKIYEENVRGTLAELAAHFEQRAPKGEIVVVVEGCPGSGVENPADDIG